MTPRESDQPHCHGARGLELARPSVDRVPPLADRVAWLRRFRDLIRAHHPELCVLASDEVGKSVFEAMTADVLPLLGSCRWHLGRGVRALRPRRVGGGGILGFGTRVERHRVPVGRVLIIATWNYPVQLVGIQLVQAVLAGNQVVVKPSERCPRTQARLLELARAAAEAIPSMRGQIEVRAATREEGRRVLAEERFDHVVFTGSTAVGRAIAESCATRLIASTLELSGSDSAIVLADADARRAARAIHFAFTANAGQTCMAPRRVFVERGAAAEFTAELARLVAGARRVRLVDAAAASAAQAAATAAIAGGGRALAGAIEPIDPNDGRAMRPVVVADCPTDGALFHGRHFGPALALRVVDSLDEALELHRSVGQYLATSVWTRRRGREVEERLAALGSGLVHLNATLLPSGHPAIVISGHGASGWGGSRGEGGLLALTREVYLTRSSRLLSPPAGEPDARARGIFSRILAFPRRPIEPPDARPARTEPTVDARAESPETRGAKHPHAGRVTRVST